MEVLARSGDVAYVEVFLPAYVDVPIDVPGSCHADEGVVVSLLVEQAVALDGLVVEHGAEAGLPFCTADHAEFGAAAAGHVVAAHLEFNGRFAVVAVLPAFFFGDLLESLCGGVLGASL